MRKITPAPTHEVQLHRADGNVIVRLCAPPLGHRAMIERYYTPPQVFVNTQPVDDKAAQAEYSVLMAFVLLADVLTGEDKPTTPKPASAAARPAWDAYARALREEFEGAGYCEGDITALLRGYHEVSTGRGRELGKPVAPSPESAGA